MRITLEDNSAQNAQENRIPTDEELKQQRKDRVAAMTPRERFLYFLDYYKIPLIAAIAAVIVIATLVRDIRSNLPDGFVAEFLNSQLFVTEELQDGFAAAAGIDTAKESVRIDTDQLSATWEGSTQADIYVVQKLMARLSAAEIDVIAADADNFAQYAREGYFHDLREVLSDAELSFYEPYLVYEAAEVDEGVFGDAAPYGIRLDGAARLTETGAYPDGGVIGIVVNTGRTERAVLFLNFLFGR